MSDYNPISDREIHELFKQRLLSQDVDDALNQKLIDMETQLAFSNDLLLMPDLAKEKAMLRKLNQKTGFGSWGKWLYTGLSCAVVITAAIIYSFHQPVTKTLLPVPAPVEKQQANTLHNTEPADVSQIKSSGHPVKNSINPSPANDQQNILPVSDTVVGRQAPLLPVCQSSPILNFAGASGINRSFLKLTNDSNKISLDTLFRGIKRVEIDGSFCDVNVNTHAETYLSLDAKMSFAVKGLVIRKPEYKLHYTQKDSVLTVWVENTKKSSIYIVGSFNSEGHLNIVMPKQTVVLIKNASGKVYVNGLEGPPCFIGSNYGSIKAENIKSKLNIHSSSGGITLSDIVGDINCKASYGDVNCRKITGDVTIGSSSGNIKLLDVTGNATLACNYGNTDLRRINGNVILKVLSGNVFADGLVARSVTINDLYGDVTLANVSASLNITSSSGQVNLNKIKGPVWVNALYGDIHVKEMAGHLDLRSSSGNIHVSSLTGAMFISARYGDITASDCIGQVNIRSSSGNIRGKNIQLVKDLYMTADYGDINMNLSNDINDLSFSLNSGSGEIKLDKDGIRIKGKEGKLELQKGNIHVKSVSRSGNQTFD